MWGGAGCICQVMLGKDWIVEQRRSWRAESFSGRVGGRVCHRGPSGSAGRQMTTAGSLP